MRITAAAFLAVSVFSLPAFAQMEPEVVPPAQPAVSPPPTIPEPLPPETPRIRQSLVKIFTTSREPDLARPWTKQPPEESTGSGLVIDGNRILTNHHVIAYASQVFVQPDGSSDRLVAKVVQSSEGIDLAVLELSSEEFFETHPPLPFSDELPQVGASVTAYGYPLGGDALSVTKGVVSRIEYTTYGRATRGLRIQVDAALNPGNSGGPAVMDGKLVGVVFSGINTAQNIGYLIPVEEVRAFLASVEAGTPHKRPQFYGQTQTLENDALRAKLKAPRSVTGIVLTKEELDDPDFPLKPFDIIAKIGEFNIDNGGMIEVANNLRLAFDYQVPRLAKDGKVPMTIFRDGEEMRIDVPVKRDLDRLLKDLDNGYPEYFIVGPMTFTPVYLDHLMVFRQNLPFLMARSSPILTRASDLSKSKGEELVVGPARLFPHPLVKGYDAGIFPVLESVNGTEIKNLAHLVQVIRDSKDEFLTFTWADDGVESLVFRREEMIKATEEILDDNGIRYQMSDRLKPIWDGKEDAPDVE